MWNFIIVPITMLKVLKWPFRTYTNFFLTSLGIVGASFWGYSIYSESKFNQPIIGESIKLLGKQSQVKELIGYPLSYSFSIQNRFVEKDGEVYYSFQVSGPKSKVDVEMTAGAATAGQLYSPEQQTKINQLKSQISQEEAKLSSLAQQRKKANKQRVKEIDLEKIASESNIKTLQRELIEKEFELIDKRQRFFVPEKELYTKASSHKSKDSSEPIAEDTQLWGINDLVLTMPNRTKMIVFPEPKKPFEKKQQIVNNSTLDKTLTLGDLNQRFKVDLSEFSEEEVKQYAAQKTAFMFTKHGSLRIFSGVVMLGLIVGSVMYKQKNVLKNISGSILEQELIRLASRHPQVGKVLQQKGKRSLQFDKIIGGGIANNEFKCVLYINNLTNGRLECQGRYDEEKNVYEHQKIVLKYIEQGEKKKIDLML